MTMIKCVISPPVHIHVVPGDDMKQVDVILSKHYINQLDVLHKILCYAIIKY